MTDERADVPRLSQIAEVISQQVLAHVNELATDINLSISDLGVAAPQPVPEAAAPVDMTELLAAVSAEVGGVAGPLAEQLDRVEDKLANAPELAVERAASKGAAPLTAAAVVRAGP